MVKTLWQKWSRLVRRVTNFIGRVILVLVYFTVVAFIVLIAKFFPSKNGSGWIECKEAVDFKRQS